MGINKACITPKLHPAGHTHTHIQIVQGEIKLAFLNTNTLPKLIKTSNQGPIKLSIFHRRLRGKQKRQKQEERGEWLISQRDDEHIHSISELVTVAKVTRTLCFCKVYAWACVLVSYCVYQCVCVQDQDLCSAKWRITGITVQRLGLQRRTETANDKAEHWPGLWVCHVSSYRFSSFKMYFCISFPLNLLFIIYYYFV